MLILISLSDLLGFNTHSHDTIIAISNASFFVVHIFILSSFLILTLTIDTVGELAVPVGAIIINSISSSCSNLSKLKYLLTVLISFL